MKHRPVAALAAVATVALGLVVGAPPAHAAGSITPWTTSVAVGGTFSASANGCPSTEDDGDTGYTIQEAQLVLVTGTGAGERLAAVGRQSGGVRQRFRVPGWVDPAQPAVVTGACVRTEYSYEDDTETATTLFTYADVAIDVTPGTAAYPGPLVSIDRSTAAGGQVIDVAVTGCAGVDAVDVYLFPGGDLSGRHLTAVSTSFGGEVDAAGSAHVPLALNTGFGFSGEEGGGPLPEGPYALVAFCSSYDSQTDVDASTLSSPQLVTVAGTNDSGSMTVDVDRDGLATIAGAGCTGGREVTVKLTTFVFTEGVKGLRHQVARAAASRDLRRLHDLRKDSVGPSVTTIQATPAADGTWSTTYQLAAEHPVAQVGASCGDPSADGFAYVSRYVFDQPSADVYLDRVSPTSSPAGGKVTAYVAGECDGDLTAVIVDDHGDILSQSGPVVQTSPVAVAATLTAPSTPGQYQVGGACDDELGYTGDYTVFAPQTVAATSPLPAEPTEGWPSQGPRETYHGRIGPISLPAMDMGEEAGRASVKDLGPSGLFIKVPRPAGDFAITKITFDLVDADGMPVPQTSAHLHHFVITNNSAKNPACPNGTFGLSGAIVGAAGAERTVLQTGDPYGLVVKKTDAWSGVYELMSRSMEDQTVFLTYDLDIRRDVQNVRPITSYFGSATGCNSFTWDIDGSGTPDTQSHYITIAKSGRLIGTGAHIHNGASYADMTNDRGRRLCRSVITYGTEPVGHTGMDGLRAVRSFDVTATTAVGMPTSDYPPEFYDDDLGIKSISNCPLQESVTKGERLRFDAVYGNERGRSGAMGIYTAYVWEGGGPAEPGPASADPVTGNPNYTG